MVLQVRSYSKSVCYRLPFKTLDMTWIYLLRFNILCYLYMVISSPVQDLSNPELATVGHQGPIPQCYTPEGGPGLAPCGPAICALAFSSLNDAIAENPNPIIWGEPGGIEDGCWFDSGVQCTIHVGGNPGYSQQRFPLERVKILARKILA